MPAPISGRVPFTFRLDEATREKARVIARREDRNLNSQLEYWIKKAVEQYERENGVVTPEFRRQP